jgi:Copper transport outer membrane protein, MctB
LINIRYHIISLVAVFLALGVGVALGSAFIDTAVVGQLEANIDTLSAQKNELQADHARMQAQLDAVEQLGVEAGAELLAGHLDGVPVFAVGVRGIDEDPVNQTADAMVDAGAAFAGTLWLTDRLALDDESERQELAGALGLDPAMADDVDGLRDALVLRLGNALADPLRSEDPLAEAGDEPADAVVVPLEPQEPTVVTNLRAAGFVDFEAPADVSADAGLLLPTAGARMVMASGQGAVVPDDEIVVPLLRRLIVSGPVPVVAAQSFDENPPGDEAPDRTSFVGIVRDDEDLRAGLSSVDDIELFIGRVAAVLALEQAADGVVGHFGLGEGADQVAPARPEEE